jgi:hypothetical protein
MPEQRQGPDAPGRAAQATIERIKREIASHPDPEALNEIRAAFRREIPLHLRSYAAALLILEAAAPTTREGRRDGKKPAARQADSRRGNDSPKAEKPRKEAQAPEPRLDENRPRYEGEGATIFFGMGKRQRLYPRVLYRILTEDAHMAPEEIGDIRSFDNYSFADIDPLCAETLIASLEGYVFRSRVLPVNRARKRGGAEEAETAQEAPSALDTVEDVLPIDEVLEDETGTGDDFTDEYEGVDESFGLDEDPPTAEDADELDKGDKGL